MKKHILILCALAALVSCKSLKEEWQPVFTDGYEEPWAAVPVSEKWLQENEGLEGFTTIQDLKSLYKGKPVVLSGNRWVKGQIISDDRSGNVYRELYIQDETGGIDLKIGKSSLYSEYRRGQWIYVKCDGLTLGAYSGMPQLGLEADQTVTNEYETTYIDLQAIIDLHIFKGEHAKAVKPVEVTEADIKRSLDAGFTGELWGKLVTIKGLTYKNEIFALLYPNPNLPHKSANPENRVFLSDNGNWGVTTWSCSKSAYIKYIQDGLWDTAEVGSGATRYGPITGSPAQYLPEGKTLDSFGTDAEMSYKEIMLKYAAANYISHYFTLGSTDVQVRTSGYAKFADEPLSKRVLSGAPVDITGILTLYVSSSGSAAQFTLVDEPSVSVIEP